MDDLATHRPAPRVPPADLASIVLAQRASPRIESALEGAPIHALPRGFDARSVLVLVLVVSTMAGVIGWATSAGTEPPLAESAAAPGTKEPAQTIGPELKAVPAAPARPMAAAGIDLAPRRLVALRSGSGGGILRISVANQGLTAVGAGGTQLLFLLDGSVVGERVLGEIDATSSATTELVLDTCPSGRRHVAVLVDPRGLVAEADERDNSTTQAVSFGC